MDGNNRRKKLEELLLQKKEPVSGTDLAKILNVSRQVIVQDIALLRACNKNILSTYKGYLIFQNEATASRPTKTFYVNHNDQQMKEELYTIVDNGGNVLDVIVDHPIYGQIIVDLIINSRADVDEFCEKMEKENSRPLNELTNGCHYHTVTAADEKTLLRIEAKLQEKGYLIRQGEK